MNKASRLAKNAVLSHDVSTLMEAFSLVKSFSGIRIEDDYDYSVYCAFNTTTYNTIYEDDRAVSAKWLKACLDAKKLVSRTSMILYRPFPRLLKERILCLTGFGSDDRLKMESYIVYENS